MVERKGIISEEELREAGPVDTWPLPSLGKGRVIPNAKREAEARSKERVENVAQTSRPRHLTAEEISNITREAEEEGFKSGYEEGFAKGEIQGEKKGRTDGETKAWEEEKARLQDECERLQAICDRLSVPLQSQDETLEKTLLDMAFYFASSLLQKEIEQQPEALHAQIGKAVQALPVGASNMTIYLNPDDAALMQNYLPEKHQNWPIQVDPEMSRGGCRVETRESLVDFSVEKRWLAMLENVQSTTEAEDADPKDEA